MSTLADRQRVEIQRCFDAFDSQFREWHARVEKPQWAMHYTQVHAATALLNGFRESVRAEGAEALDEVEGLVLSAWRVWEAFRSRLSQRQEEMFVAGLQAADEIAWACRKPMVEAFAEAKKTMPVEPPLTCLHGSTSPTALVRRIPFSGEGVESAFPSEYSRRLLQSLPFPIISLPWHELFHAPGMVAVAHETGHVVERDCGLEEAVWAAIQPVTPPEAQERWKKWRAEIFADFTPCGTAARPLPVPWRICCSPSSTPRPQIRIHLSACASSSALPHWNSPIFPPRLPPSVIIGRRTAALPQTRRNARPPPQW